MLKKLLYSFHRGLPASIRNLYAPLFRWRYWPFWNTCSGTFLELYLLTGEIQGGGSMTYAYAGSRRELDHQWSSNIFPDGCQREYLGRTFFLLVPWKIRKSNPSCSMFLTETSIITQGLQRRRSGFDIPVWVELEVPLDKPVQEMRNTSSDRFGDTERRIRKNKLSYNIVNDEAAFREFYYTMHIPFIEARYGNSAVFMRDRDAFKLHENADLLLVKMDGQSVSGILLQYFNNLPVMRVIGVKQEPENMSKYGVIGACYYFSLLEAEKRGYKRLNIGGVFPLLRDTLLQFKRSFGGKVIPNAYLTTDHLRMIPLSMSSAFRKFLSDNPIIYYPASGCVTRAVFAEEGQHDEKKMQQLLKETDLPGVTATHIFGFSNISKHRRWDQQYRTLVK
jgi:hypothetical protein